MLNNGEPHFGGGYNSPWKTFRALTARRQQLQAQYADCKLELRIIEDHPDLYTQEQIAELGARMTEVLKALRVAMDEEEAFAQAHPEVLQANGKAEAGEAEWEHRLLKQKNGRTVACPANIAIILRHTPTYTDTLRYNTFSGQIEVGPGVIDEYGRERGRQRWTDRDDAELSSYLLEHYAMAVTSLGHCAQVAAQVAQDHSYDPVTTWLDSLPEWDKEPRLESFFTDYCEVDQTPYIAWCGKSFFLSLMARAYRPGCQMDTSLVLQGPQGGKKTSLCRLLGGPWFKEITIDVGSKDFYQSLRGTWIGEIAELDSFRKTEQSRIKAVLTKVIDSYRLPYGRHEIDQPRRTVFVGTTNDLEFLQDMTGGRRFYPVKVGNINLDAVAAILLQLFAEARDRYKTGENWWEESEEVKTEAAERREDVREIDPWEEKLATYAAAHPGPLHMVDLLGSLCLDVATERQRRTESTRIGLILHRMGYEKVRRRRAEDGMREYFYVRTK